jgi:hypothetical protein
MILLNLTTEINYVTGARSRNRTGTASPPRDFKSNKFNML